MSQEDRELTKLSRVEVLCWPKIEPLFLKMQTAFNNEEYDLCVETAEQLLKQKPSLFFTKCYYGRALYHKGDLERAIVLLSECIEEENYFFLWKFRGDCYWGLGDYGRALSDYLGTIEQDPTNGSAYDCAAMCYFNTGDLARAHLLIDKVIQMETESDIPMIRKAQFFEYQGEPELAKMQFRKVLEAFPSSKYARKRLKELET